LDWSKLPDLAAVTLLATAFSAVARRSQASVSELWLTGWALIALHFAASIFAHGGGASGTIAVFIGLTSLAWAGILFMWAFVPYRKSVSSISMAAVLLGTTGLYIGIILVEPARPWALILAAILFGVLPLSVALMTLRTKNNPLRWMLVGLFCGIAVFLLIFQTRPGSGLNIALNGVLFTVYFGCSLHFLYAYRQRTTGAFITISGFLGWAAVFVVAPGLGVILPNLQLESEVWNLPKYVVAVGMILVLLEEQIEHNKYLALHDELTGLPNRRLFQDRLSSALERARRSGSQAALLLIDLDQFKQVNDSLGHHAGDQVLKHVGKVFGDRIRRSDTVARTGGDEFSLILDDPISREDAERVGRSLTELLDAPFELGDQVVRIGASVGIAVYPEDALDAEGLCIAADLRMYDFKHRSGRHEHLARLPKSVALPIAEDPIQSQQAG